MKLRMARSIAGHDKGDIYILLGEDGRDVILINGKNRPMDQPKRKRRTHVQLIEHLPPSLTRTADAAEWLTDETARQIIRQYINMRQKPQEERKIVKSGCH